VHIDTIMCAVQTKEDSLKECARGAVEVLAAAGRTLSILESSNSVNWALKFEWLVTANAKALEQYAKEKEDPDFIASKRRDNEQHQVPFGGAFNYVLTPLLESYWQRYVELLKTTCRTVQDFIESDHCTDGFEEHGVPVSVQQVVKLVTVSGSMLRLLVRGCLETDRHLLWTTDGELREIWSEYTAFKFAVHEYPLMALECAIHKKSAISLLQKLSVMHKKMRRTKRVFFNKLEYRRQPSVFERKRARV